MHRGCQVCVICNSNVSFLYIQTLHNDCSYIEDVHLLFCAHLINISHVYGCLTFFSSEIGRGVWFV